MNVLYIDQFSDLGGAQQCLRDLLNAVEERAWNATVALPNGGPLVDLLRKRAVRVETFPAGRYGCGRKTAADYFQFAADVPMQANVIARILRESSYNLVYVNGPRVLASAILAVRGRVPLLFHAHHSIQQYSAAHLEGWLLRKSRATVAACCSSVADPLRKWVLPRNLHVLANGTEDLGYHERPFPQGGEVRIGIIGRISPEKGQVEFLRAAARLAANSPRLRFVICGAPLFGDDSYYREVLRLAGNLPVEFLDWRDDVGTVMRSLDILAVASKHEGMPRVILEAFSAGLPVVALPVGGIPEVVQDGFTGYLAKTDLATTLADVLQISPVRLRSIARNARDHWERRYTVAAYCERVMTLMERCATRETAVRPKHRSTMPQPAPEDTRNA